MVYLFWAKMTVSKKIRACKKMPLIALLFLLSTCIIVQIFESPLNHSIFGLYREDRFLTICGIVPIIKYQ